MGGLTNAEYLVLSALEGGAPLALWQIAGDFARGVFGMLPTAEEVVALLGPALAALAERGSIEVRCFAGWPGVWDEGTPAGWDDLVAVSRRAAAWSAAPGDAVVVARITRAGVRQL